MSETCLSCEYHRIINDRDPDDCFCDDDVAVVCTLTRNNEQNKNSKYYSDQSKYRSIAISCRPYKVKSEAGIPKWCPKQIKKVDQKEYITRLENAVDMAADWLSTISSADGSGHADLAIRLQEISGRKKIDVRSKSKKNRTLKNAPPLEENSYEIMNYDLVNNWAGKYSINSKIKNTVQSVDKSVIELYPCPFCGAPGTSELYNGHRVNCSAGLREACYMSEFSLPLEDWQRYER